MDRYLSLVCRDIEVPPVTHLVATCMLMAAKLETHSIPSFESIIEKFPEEFRMTCRDLCRLELKILVRLEFSVQ